MNCKKYQKQIISYLDGELRQDLANELNTHVSGCKKCNEALENLQHVYRLIESEKSEFYTDTNLSTKILTKIKSKKSNGLPLRYTTIASLAAAGIAFGILIGTLYTTNSEIKSASTQDWEQLTEEYMPVVENNPYNLVLTTNELPTKP
jgi:hypothetical protein